MAINNKKAQGMPVNVIIVAALALMVLVVLVVIFSGKVKLFSESLQSCTAKQGQCKPSPCQDNYASISNTECKKPETCCVQVFSGEEAKTKIKDDTTR